MPTYNPTPRNTTAALELNPDAGNAGVPNYASVLKILADRAELGRVGLAGQLVWSGQLWASGTAAAPSVFVGPISSVVLARSGGVIVEQFGASGTTLGAAQIEGGGVLGASTWYYVYAYNNAGSLAYQISTTPPTLAPTPGDLELWKRGAAGSHRYLGCFVTDGSGDPLPVRRAGGRYTYLYSAITTPALGAGVGGCKVLDAGATTSPLWGAISCASLVPPHAFTADLRFLVSGAGYGFTDLRTTGTSSGYSRLDSHTAGGGMTHHLRHVLGSSRNLEYSNDAAGTRATAYVLGFEE